MGRDLCARNRRHSPATAIPNGQRRQCHVTEAEFRDNPAIIGKEEGIESGNCLAVEHGSGCGGGRVSQNLLHFAVAQNTKANIARAGRGVEQNVALTVDIQTGRVIDGQRAVDANGERLYELRSAAGGCAIDAQPGDEINIAVGCFAHVGKRTDGAAKPHGGWAKALSNRDRRFEVTIDERGDAAGVTANHGVGRAGFGAAQQRIDIDRCFGGDQIAGLKEQPGFLIHARCQQCVGIAAHQKRDGPPAIDGAALNVLHGLVKNFAVQKQDRFYRAVFPQIDAIALVVERVGVDQRALRRVAEKNTCLRRQPEGCHDAVGREIDIPLAVVIERNAENDGAILVKPRCGRVGASADETADTSGSRSNAGDLVASRQQFFPPVVIVTVEDPNCSVGNSVDRGAIGGDAEVGIDGEAGGNFSQLVPGVDERVVEPVRATEETCQRSGCIDKPKVSANHLPATCRHGVAVDEKAGGGFGTGQRYVAVQERLDTRLQRAQVEFRAVAGSVFVAENLAIAGDGVGAEFERTGGSTETGHAAGADHFPRAPVPVDQGVAETGKRSVERQAAVIGGPEHRLLRSQCPRGTGFAEGGEHPADVVGLRRVNRDRRVSNPALLQAGKGFVVGVIGPDQRAALTRGRD